MSLRDDLLKPISGDNPAGANLRYEPVFDQIKEARREDEIVPGAEEERKTADFKLVKKLAQKALAKQSKDLWLAAWLTEALLKTDGINGLGEGLQVIQGLLEEFWDHVHPAIEDPEDIELRAAPLSWIGQRQLAFAVQSVPLNKRGHSFLQCTQARDIPTEADAKGDKDKKASRDDAVQEGKLTPEEFESGVGETPKQWYKDLVANLNECFTVLGGLTTLCDDKFADVDADRRPTFTGLQEALTDVQGATQLILNKKLELDPDPPEAEPEVAEMAASASASGAGAPISIEPNNADDAATRIAVAARFLRKEQPTNPASYLMLRGFRWGELRVNGQELDPRLLAPPPTAVRAKLKGLLLDEKWEELLAEGEWVMAQPYGRGWLDLQRYILTACEALGSEYEPVAGAIRGSLAALLRDLPKLPQLTLMDDTQTANAETKAWLREQLAAEAATGRVAISIPEDEEAVVAEGPVKREAPEALFARALSLMRAGRPQKGIELLMAAADQEKSPRNRFLRRAEATGIMVDSGNEPIALPILKELLEQIDNHKLEEWEAGDVVARPIGLLYRCMTALDAESPDARKNLYLRVCRLDPILAMTFNDKAASAQAAQPAPPPQPAEAAPAEPQAPDA